MIKSQLLNKDEIIDIFVGKPLNFNNKKLSMEEMNDNYKKIEQEINYKFKKVIKPNQTHSSNVQIVTEDNIDDLFIETDGLITNIKGIALATTLADCQGIHLYDQENKVIANVHSGWKGTLQKIIINAVNMMIENFDTKPENLLCYITPSIEASCFEVDEDVKELFVKEYKNIEEYITQKNNKYYIDTLSINKKNLMDLGVLEENVEISNICTKCSDDCHSYRREKMSSGRNISIICIKE